MAYLHQPGRWAGGRPLQEIGLLRSCGPLGLPGFCLPRFSLRPHLRVTGQESRLDPVSNNGVSWILEEDWPWKLGPMRQFADPVYMRCGLPLFGPSFRSSVPSTPTIPVSVDQQSQGPFDDTQVHDGSTVYFQPCPVRGDRVIPVWL